MTTWEAGITAITLFVDDVDAAREFYLRAFDVPLHFGDDVSAVVALGGTLINLLQSSEGDELITPARVGDAAAGSRMQLTLTVDDVDATVELLRSRGVAFLNGPQDRPWGIRTAAFQDPAGHVWEIAD